MGYKDKKYYKQIPILKNYKFINFPDDILNIDIDCLSAVAKRNDKVGKDLCNNYFLKNVSLPNILSSVKKIVRDR